MSRDRSHTWRCEELRLATASRVQSHVEVSESFVPLSRLQFALHRQCPCLGHLPEHLAVLSVKPPPLGLVAFWVEEPQQIVQQPFESRVEVVAIALAHLPHQALHLPDALVA